MNYTYNEKECPFYLNSKCNIAKQFRYNNCNNNDICLMREQYYKEHPEIYIQFGKYKYSKYIELPKNYIAWLLKQDIKEIKKYLEDSILEIMRESTIKKFIEDNYKTFNKNRNSWAYQSRSKSYSKSEDYCPYWLDYGSDLMDCMEEPF